MSDEKNNISIIYKGKDGTGFNFLCFNCSDTICDTSKFNQKTLKDQITDWFFRTFY